MVQCYILWPQCVPCPRKHRNRHQDHQFWVDSYRLDLWPFEGFGGHLGRHLEKKLFWGSDFGKLLVCRKVHWNLTESIEKPFVAIFLGLNCILTGLECFRNLESYKLSKSCQCSWRESQGRASVVVQGPSSYGRGPGKRGECSGGFTQKLNICIAVSQFCFQSCSWTFWRC